MGALPLVARGRQLFEDLLAPLVSLEYTLLLFATLLFHVHYFGEAHAMADFAALDSSVLWVTTLYGAIVLLASLVRIPQEWLPITTLMVFIGNVWVSVVYTSLYWLALPMPTWGQLLAGLYYLLQSVLSFTVLILLFSREEGTRLHVVPRLGALPGPLKTVAILLYVVGMTLLLEQRLAVAPDIATAQVNLLGVLLLEGLERLTRGRS
ncbi:MAG: hypothetical protein ACLFU8_17675 [Anaerolineales bacterium]